MKTSKIGLALTAVAAGLMASSSAFAWHHHGGGSRVFLGFNFGFPAYYGAPYYYPPPVVYAPAPVVVQQSPTVYVERNDLPPAASAQPSANYWYYCADSRTYYPYVKECPGGWQRVSPTPPG